MKKSSLEAKARELARTAATSRSGRAADTVYGGHEKQLRQTLVALAAGQRLAEHESPGEATLLVINGRIRLVAGDASWSGREWDFLIIPNETHSVEADTDAAFLLTVSMKR